MNLESTFGEIVCSQ